MDEQKKLDLLNAARLIRDLCRDNPSDCDGCLLFDIGCRSFTIPEKWKLPGDPPPLLPCPFCGGEVNFQYNFDLNGADSIACVKCGARIFAECTDDEHSLAERWNRRKI